MKNKLTELIGRTSKYIVRYFPASSKKIYFENFRGRGFGDDPRYIAEELHKRNPDYKLYWLVSDYSVSLPEYITPVKYGSLAAAYALSTSKVWVSNIKNSYKPRKKKNQYYIQCWHSTVGLKRNEADAKTLDPDYVAAAKYDASLTDLMYSDNDYRIEKYSNHFWYNGKVIKCGVPRVSAMHNRREEFVSLIREKYSVPEGNRIAMYVPTFRAKRGVEAYTVDHRKYLDALEKKFGCKFTLILKMHPSMKDKSFPNMEEDMVDASLHEDPYELIAAADVIVSDYSDCLFNAIFLKKPLLLIAKDYEEYASKDRGFAIPVDTLPFKFAKSEDELAGIIETLDEQKYIADCDAFLASIGYEDNFDGEKILSDIVEEQLKR